MSGSKEPLLKSTQQDWRNPRVWIIAAIILLTVLSIGSRFAWQALNRPEPIVIAFAGSMTGPLAPIGEEARVATQLYLDKVNGAGGIGGRMLQLQVFDDESKPALARANVPAILASRAVAVLGHSASVTSVEAGPGYKDGHIAAVAGNATTDELTRDNPYYFCALSPISTEAEFLAEYIHTIIMSRDSAFMRSPDIDLVTNGASYGHSFSAGFQRNKSGVEAKLFTFEPDYDPEASANMVANQLAQEPEPRIIILGLGTEAISPVLKAIRRHGIRSMMILGPGAAADSFAEQFVAEPEERDEPGFFTDNVFAIAPIILDNTGDLGQELAFQYVKTTGKRAGWFAAGMQNAARVLVEAIRRADIGNTKAMLEDNREKVRGALASTDNLAKSVPGINGALYFNAQREMPQAEQVGYFREDHLLSAPLQLLQVKDRDLVDIGKEIKQGHMVQIGEKFYWLQRVVYTGIDITHLDRIDAKEGTFNADFYLWMRYAEGDNLPSQIELTGFSGAFESDHPLQSSQEEGQDYRLWRVSGKFKANFDLHDYPFDTQTLLIRLQNRDHPREQIAYAIDTFGLQLDRRGKSSVDIQEAFRDLQQWHVTAVRPFVDFFSIESTLGKPALFGTSNRTEYGGFDTEIIVQRNAFAFMVKTLIPLFLLILVVFTTLFFPNTLAKERTTIPVTGILTSAVLLLSIHNQLPPLGYPVAIEYLFYVFFLLCLMAMLTGLLSEILRLRSESLRDKQIHRHVIHVDWFGRIAYVAIVAVTAAFYLSNMIRR